MKNMTVDTIINGLKVNPFMKLLHLSKPSTRFKDEQLKCSLLDSSNVKS